MSTAAQALLVRARVIEEIMTGHNKIAIGDAVAHQARDDERLTDELLQELLAAPDAQTFISSHDLTGRTVPGYLDELLKSKNMKRIEAVRASCINETFGYQIFKGQRNASRDKLLQIALAMGCDLLEVNRLLKIAGVSELYCKNRRDAIIIFCIDHGCTLQEVNEELYGFHEKTVC